ncbi:endonuclease/exonuclease/phosphatase family protein [Micromonospora echinofusca]|uniref:endonuclease/exonuclease/phosphatase family protein n=1 Tax=Micromonospora echinofusca TaxID=47858 RepID=UPI000C70E779|nr:endonuclease/exonuclease/phosphatase family protein [Micromonospora sp. MSM11]MCL7459984.1 endonuclease/exonuclease/phosphatase family protein [Micromonospora sp. MSM11]
MLRAMTWNIRTGGRDRGGADRRDLLVRVVAAERPDVLALQELRDFDDRPAAAPAPAGGLRADGGGVLADFAGRVGMRPHLARSCFGQPVAVLLRPPLRALAATRVRRPFHHAAQRVSVATTAGALTVLSVHLDPYSGLRRRVEAGWAAAALRRAPGRLGLLAGDLNTLDPVAEHTDRIARLPAAYRRRHLRRDGRTVETRAVARLLAAGLVDLYAAAGRTDDGLTAPTRHGGGAEFSGMRLDYLFGTAALAERVRDCRVLRGGETEYASDHYPVVADLDLDPA